MKITSKGQITIPQALRDRFGFLPNTEVEFKPIRGGLKIEKAVRQGRRGELLLKRLTGRGDGSMSTDEIMQLTRGDG